MKRFLTTLTLTVVFTSHLQAGWWHHHHRHVVYQSAPVYAAPSYAAPVYSAPVYSAPAYSAPAYAAPMYSAPQYYVPAPQADTQSAPLQNVFVGLLEEMLRDRIERLGNRPIFGGSGGGVGGGSGGQGGQSTSSLSTEVGQLRSEVKDLSLRVENANSILQSHGKKLVENERALDELSRKFQKGGEIYDLLIEVREHQRTARNQTGGSAPASVDEERDGPPPPPLAPRNPPEAQVLPNQ